MEIVDKSYCTFSPDTIFGHYIGKCCKLHDAQYRKYRKSMTRKEADLMFAYCLRKKLPRYLHIIAFFYYLAVRMFSGPSWKRWEYKWFLGIFPIKNGSKNTN